jgi:crotonobetainyl-CoA:carnitine CoA-transferase CaiB-like acyl-CoA transferase
MDSSELLKKLEASGIPCTPVNTVADAINYEPLAPNFSIIKYDNKYCYIPNFPIFGLPVKELTEVPELGSNTREILLRLGFSESEIEALVKKGIIKC